MHRRGREDPTAPRSATASRHRARDAGPSRRAPAPGTGPDRRGAASFADRGSAAWLAIPCGARRRGRSLGLGGCGRRDKGEERQDAGVLSWIDHLDGVWPSRARASLSTRRTPLNDQASRSAVFLSCSRGTVPSNVTIPSLTVARTFPGNRGDRSAAEHPVERSLDLCCRRFSATRGCRRPR